MAMTFIGLPGRYRVLPGATLEGRSLIPVVEARQEDDDVTEAVIVGDRGMLSETSRTINQDKITQARRRDGLHEVITNLPASSGVSNPCRYTVPSGGSAAH